MSEPWTPGPWRAEQREWGWVVREDRDGPADYLVERASESDVRLIALAPEMAEAMEWFCHRVQIGEVRSVSTYARFRALLARARGEST